MALFGASDKPRPARDKLGRMGGIMASSADLMEAVQESNPPAPAPMAPSMGASPMTTPLQPSLPTQAPPPAPMPPAPMPPAPAPGQPVNAALAGSNPTSAALNAQATKRPMQMNKGGDVDVSKTPVVPKTGGVLLASLMATPGLSMIVPGLVKKYGSEEKAEEELTKKKAALDASVSSGNTENIANTLLDVSDLPINDENKKDFVSNVLGPDKVTNDIDDLNNKMAGIAVQGAGTSGATKEYIQALLYGLNLKRNTAAARAKAKADAAGSASDYTPERLRQRTIEAILKDPDQFDVYNEAGSVDPAKVQQQADILVRSMQPTPAPTSSPSSNNLPTISTQQEYDALPSGSEFMQNGQKRRKP